MDTSPEAKCAQASGSSKSPGSWLDEGSWPYRETKCAAEAPSCGGSGLGGEAHGLTQPTRGNPRRPRPHGRRRPAFLWIFLALPDTRSNWASFLSLPTSISSCKRKEQNRKCLRQSAPWVDERKQRVRLHPSARPSGFGQGPGPRPCCCWPYVAEGVCPVSRGVDVAWRGGPVTFRGRRIGDDRGLPGVAGAHPDRWKAGTADQ